MLKAVIIEDEINSAELLKHLIDKNCPGISIIGLETSPKKGIELIEKLKPHVVFLDIEMPKMSGFELLEQLKHLSFYVIFTTAYDNYALKSYQYNTVDYLLKPIIKNELQAAVAKLEERVKNKLTDNGIHQFLENMRTGQSRLALHSQNEITYIDTDKIMRLESDSGYTNIILVAGKKITSSKILKDYEALLNPTIFFRVHKTFIINLRQVEKYIKSEGGYVVMKDHARIPVSREKRQALIDILSTSL